MAGKIWIVAEHQDGELHRMSSEAVVAGQKLAGMLGADVEAVVLGSDLAAVAAGLGKFALGAVNMIEGEQLQEYTPGAYIGALRAAIDAHHPDYIVFPHTYQSVEYVPRLAQEASAALVPEVTDFEDGGDGPIWTRPVMQGKLNSKVRVKGEGLIIITIQSGAFPVDEAETGEASVTSLAIGLDAVSADREVLGVEEVAAGQVDLSQAEFIVSVGRGIGSAEKVSIAEDLAKALGAEVGASRPVIDNGWLPRDRQVGSSGQTVAPKLYIAAGISGAIQHAVGMKGSKVIVAINKDSGAPIFNLADYGIVGDLHEIIPALTKAIQEAKA